MSSRPVAEQTAGAWDVFRARFRRRAAARLALGLLGLLYGLAIFAPLLASDRPLMIVATDRGAYRSNWRELSPLVDELLGASRRQPADPRALAGPRAALERRLQALALQLPDGPRDLLRQLARGADELLAAASQDGASGERESADAALAALAARATSELALPPPGADGPLGAHGPLRPFRSYPALAELSGAEVYLMVAWTLLVLWPLGHWLRRRAAGRSREDRRARPGAWLAVLLGIPLLASLAALAARGGSGVPRGHKEGLRRGEIVATRVLFAPIPFGMAEQNFSETFRPPTWRTGAAIDEQGYYLRGARAQRTDPLTGLAVHAEPVEVRPGEPARNAAARHPLGTDSLGRDLLARLLWGARISLSVGLLSTAVLVALGTFLGALGGYLGGRADVLVSRTIEVFQCFPVFFLILVVVALVGPSVLNLMLVIGLFRWTGVARLVRGEILRLKTQEFVLAARALGAGPLRTIFRHLLPNALGPVLVAATFQVAAGILTESALSYLGFGVRYPVPSWGSLLTETSQMEHWWIQVFPGTIIFGTVMLYNLLGEGVRDALDPRLPDV